MRIPDGLRDEDAGRAGLAESAVSPGWTRLSRPRQSVLGLGDAGWAWATQARQAAGDLMRGPSVNLPPLKLPIVQKDLSPLMERLHAAGVQVLVETGGHRTIEHVPDWATVIMDVKCPGSGEVAKHDADNFGRLRPHDEVKFVVKDRADYDYAGEVIARERLAGRIAGVLVSPVHGELDPRSLAEWVLADHLPVRLQLQAHKYIWGADVRGV